MATSVVECAGPSCGKKFSVPSAIQAGQFFETGVCLDCYCVWAADPTECFGKKDRSGKPLAGKQKQGCRQCQEFPVCVKWGPNAVSYIGKTTLKGELPMSQGSDQESLEQEFETAEAGVEGEPEASGGPTFEDVVEEFEGAGEGTQAPPVTKTAPKAPVPKPAAKPAVKPAAKPAPKSAPAQHKQVPVQKAVGAKEPVVAKPALVAKKPKDGVMATIRKHLEKGSTKEKILQALTSKFPDRKPAAMMSSINTLISDLKVVKSAKGVYKLPVAS